MCEEFTNNVESDCLSVLYEGKDDDEDVHEITTKEKAEELCQSTIKQNANYCHELPEKPEGYIHTFLL